MKIADLFEEARLTARSLVRFGGHVLNPNVRLGVTGLSRAGKTVFITALVHALMQGGRLPVFQALATGRVARARLEPQPDDAVPRFGYEEHLKALTVARAWPQSTTHISELRLVVEYQSRNGSARTLTLDIVDYPGEWLLDLPLLEKSYEQWSAETMALSRSGPRAKLAANWHAHLMTLSPEGDEDEPQALTAARLFTEYLRACRDERYAMSLLPPGRFLMPGDLAGSPALTFAPLVLPKEGSAPDGSLWAMMRRRYEAYRSVVVRPFFREHFSLLDRQIVLVDVLAALNAGPDAVRDLERALGAILDCFRVGQRSLFSTMLRPRIDRILFAATKADHLHHTSHDRLEAILRRMVDRAAGRATVAGAAIDVVALAAVRATREARVRRGREELPSILGVPDAGESAGDERFDGKSEVAIFPGDLPADPDALFGPDGGFRGSIEGAPKNADYRFVRFRPPPLEQTDEGVPALPHIRLDRALQFLIGDWLE